MREVTELLYNLTLDNMTCHILCFIHCPSFKVRVHKSTACVIILLNNKCHSIPSACNFLNRNASTKRVNLEYISTNTPGSSNLRSKSNLNTYPGNIDIISTDMQLSYLNFSYYSLYFPVYLILDLNHILKLIAIEIYLSFIRMFRV